MVQFRGLRNAVNTRPVSVELSTWPRVDNGETAWTSQEGTRLRVRKRDSAGHFCHCVMHMDLRENSCPREGLGSMKQEMYATKPLLHSQSKGWLCLIFSELNIFSVASGGIFSLSGEKEGSCRRPHTLG